MKYSELVGQVVNGVYVVDCQRVFKISKKSGKEYKVTRLWVTGDGENVLEIGTQSFNKMSFLKRLEKITTKWCYRNEPTEEENVYDDYMMQFFIESLYSSKESIKVDYETICQIIRKSTNINCSKEQLFKYWNDYQYDKLHEEILNYEYSRDENDMNFIMWAKAVTELNEWQTEYEQKLWEFIKDEWYPIKQIHDEVPHLIYTAYKTTRRGRRSKQNKIQHSLIKF